MLNLPISSARLLPEDVNGRGSLLAKLGDALSLDGRFDLRAKSLSLISRTRLSRRANL
jgi:hypothetical protein